MIYLCFFFILLGSIAFIGSFVGLTYRLVTVGRINKEDLITGRIIKIGLGGLGLVLLGQIIIRIAL